VDLICKMNNITLILEVIQCRNNMMLTLNSRDGTIATIDQNNKNNIVTLTGKVELPNQLTILLDSNESSNRITSNNKYKLLSLYIGGIEFNPDRLIEICRYTPELGPVEFTNFWDKNGQVDIDIFANNFIEYHLFFEKTFNFK